MGCSSSNSLPPPVTLSADQIGIEYFPANGRAEPLRCMLNHKGVAFVEQPVEMK